MSKGSLQYWHRRRAAKPLPRMRSVPNLFSAMPTNLVGYKAGMTHLTMVNDRESPSKNQEVSEACTLIEIPTMEVYGMRLYSRDDASRYKETKTEIYDNKIAKKLGIKNLKNDETKIPELKSKIDGLIDVSLLIAAYPQTTSMSKKHVERFESRIGTTDIKAKFDFAESLMGKEIRVADVFKQGEMVDILTITKGKGWQGVIKRFGVARLQHKATQKIRHVGTLGPANPGKVLYSVPQAGQTGYHYRTEHNKRVLKIGTPEETKEVNLEGGYQNYGVIKGNYIIIKGSVGGPAKRLVRIRKAIRARKKDTIKEPKILNINTKRS
ncbi:MAG: 50S ribosomal protein L3 [Candidatus Marsarchaeota archaeon]|jgi:large subunit ribosomal protein L3|nr:50S ribosomal protein L3 [Candidatus Marsarchaeota archaeon]